MPLKSTTFQGVNLISVEPDSPVRPADLKAAAADIAGVRARLFDNTEANFIDHRGGGRGALHGIPLVNQFFGRSVGLDAGGAKNGGIVSGDQQWFPFIIPPHHEDTLLVEVDLEGVWRGSSYRDSWKPFRPRILLREFSNFTVSLMAEAEVELEFPSDAGAMCFATLRGVTTSATAVMYLVFDCSGPEDLVQISDSRSIGSVIVRSTRGGAPVPDMARDSTNPVKVYPPASGNHLEFVEMYDGTFSTSFPLNGYQTRNLDQAINGLMESLTGAPVANNASYVHTESALNDPTRDRFRAFTRKTFANEPIARVPIVSHNLGGIKSTGGYLVAPRAAPADAPTTSELERQAFAPYFNLTTKTEWSIKLQLPDAPEDKIRYAVILGSSTGVAWTDVKVSAIWGTGTETTPINPAAITGASNFATTEQAVIHVRDSNDRLRILVEKTGGGTYVPADYCLVAVAVWVEP